jgi:hypothetical protein
MSQDPVTAATKMSISSLAHRVQALDHEIAQLNERIALLLEVTALELLALSALVRTLPSHCRWPLAIILSDSVQTPPGHAFVASPPSRPHRAR